MCEVSGDGLARGSEEGTLSFRPRRELTSDAVRRWPCASEAGMRGRSSGTSNPRSRIERSRLLASGLRPDVCAKPGPWEHGTSSPLLPETPWRNQRRSHFERTAENVSPVASDDSELVPHGLSYFYILSQRQKSQLPIARQDA